MQQTIELIEHIGRQIEGIRKQAADAATEHEYTLKAVMDMEFYYGHNRSALFQHVKN